MTRLRSGTPRVRRTVRAVRARRRARGPLVTADEMILVSVDDHICEPADMFDAHVPARDRDRAPRVVDEPNGSQQWYCGDIHGRNLGRNAVGGKPPEMFNVDPLRYEHMRPGCYDVDARVRDMSAGGQLAGLNFPNWTGFSGQVWNQGPDRDVSLLMIRAYNDWHVDEWCGAHPDRFIPCGILPPQRLDAAHAAAGLSSTELFQERILCCFIADRIGAKLLDEFNIDRIQHRPNSTSTEFNIDNVCWESDSPHSDSSWPRALNSSPSCSPRLPPRTWRASHTATRCVTSSSTPSHAVPETDARPGPSGRRRATSTRSPSRADPRTNATWPPGPPGTA